MVRRSTQPPRADTAITRCPTPANQLCTPAPAAGSRTATPSMKGLGAFFSLLPHLEVCGVHIPRDFRDLRHLPTVIDSDLGLDRGLQLGAHGRDQVLVLFPVRGEVDSLLGVRLEIEEFDVVRFVEFFYRRRAVPVHWGE